MASTRKSSRVRIPKIKEDGATPVKRTKTNTSASTPAVTISPTAVATVVTVQPPAVLTPPAVAAPLMVIPSVTSPALSQEVEVMVEEPEPSTPVPVDLAGDEIAVEKVATAVFKDPNFVHSSIGAAGSKRTRVWKNLKQIIATERSLPWQPTDVTYGLIEGPPSFKPSKKYSDLSGLEARYTDPQTKLRYSSPDEFSRARTLPNDLVTGYLALRKASAPVP